MENVKTQADGNVSNVSQKNEYILCQSWGKMRSGNAPKPTSEQVKAFKSEGYNLHSGNCSTMRYSTEKDVFENHMCKHCKKQMMCYLMDRVVKKEVV